MVVGDSRIGTGDGLGGRSRRGGVAWGVLGARWAGLRRWIETASVRLPVWRRKECGERLKDQDRKESRGNEQGGGGADKNKVGLKKVWGNVLGRTRG